VIGQDFEYERTVIPTGANLPTWILCGSVKTGRRVRAQTGKVADLVTSAGCYGSMVNRIRQ